MSKRKLNTLTLQEKIDVIKFHLKNPSFSQAYIAKEFNIPPPTICRIIKNKDDIINKEKSGTFTNNIKRFKSNKYIEIDDALFTWFCQARSNNVMINGSVLQTKAQQLAHSNYGNECEINMSWINRWKSKHNICSKTLHGEGSSAPLATINEWKSGQLVQILQEFEPKDIYNVDETGLFWKMLPNKTMCIKTDTVRGNKKPKNRITVLVGASMTGEKLPLYFIGKSKCPRNMKNKRELLSVYRNNKTAWMTAAIFDEWIVKFDRSMTDRKVALIIDNCPSHVVTKELKNVTVFFLPPNCTSKIQPCDAGIISNLKQYYRGRLVTKALCAYEHGVELKFDICDALNLLKVSWIKVKESAIVNCFKHCGFSIDDNHADSETCADIDEEITSAFHQYCRTQQLSISNFSDYADLDNDEKVHIELSDEEIIGQTSQTDEKENENEDDDDEATSDVTNKEAYNALLALQKWSKNDEKASALCDQLSAIIERKTTRTIQSTLDSFIIS